METSLVRGSSFFETRVRHERTEVITLAMKLESRKANLNLAPEIHGKIGGRQKRLERGNNLLLDQVPRRIKEEENLP